MIRPSQGTTLLVLLVAQLFLFLVVAVLLLVLVVALLLVRANNLVKNDGSFFLPRQPFGSASCCRASRAGLPNTARPPIRGQRPAWPKSKVTSSSMTMHGDLIIKTIAVMPGGP